MLTSLKFSVPETLTSPGLPEAAVRSACAAGGPPPSAGEPPASHTAGGNAGTLRIYSPDLLNTTNLQLIGQGGYSTNSSNGGNGGHIDLHYRGKILNFTDIQFDEDPVPIDYNEPILIGGNGTSGAVGTEGSITFNKDLECLPFYYERDADPGNDGIVDNTDFLATNIKYNNQTGLYPKDFDISCRGRVNVVALTRVGLEYISRTPNA